MSRPLDIAVMKLEKAVIELRHPPALLLWDRSGALWKNMQKAIPGIEPADASPNITRFRLPPSDELVVELETHRLLSAQPDRKLTEFKRRCEAFCRTVMETLEISQLRRVGLRVIYSQSTQTPEEAATLVLAHGVLRAPQSLDTQPPFAGALSMPEAAFRWEGKAVGVSYRLRAETRNYEFKVPVDFPTDVDLSPLRRPRHYATVDLDYYSTTSMSREQLVVGEWIESALRVLRREADRLLGNKAND